MSLAYCLYLTHKDESGKIVRMFNYEFLVFIYTQLKNSNKISIFFRKIGDFIFFEKVFFKLTVGIMGCWSVCVTSLIHQ